MPVQPPEPLPPAAGLLYVPPRRPGELHEPIQLPTDQARELAIRTARIGLGADVAATLLLEAQIVRDDLSALGLGRLSADAGAGPYGRALSPAEADYARSLHLRHRRPPATAREYVAIPVRLVALATPARWQAALRGDLGRAVAWELAALKAGMTMREWGLLAAARALRCSG